MNKIFFGWYIVAATVLLMSYNSIIFVYGFTAFMSPISLTFGSYTLTSIAMSLRGLESGTLDPLVGMAADRWPARRLMIIGVIMYAIGILVISQSTNTAIFGESESLHLVMFYVGFLVSGLGGAACISVVPMTVSARWFHKNLGKANGIMATGMAIGGLFVPLIVIAIDKFSWQNTLLGLAVGALIIGIPASLLFRNRPEDYGMLPDGRPQEDVEGTPPEPFGLTVRETLRTRAFWFIGLSSMFQMMAMMSVNAHIMPYLESASVGMVTMMAATGVSILSVASLAARIPFGALADMFKKRQVMALSMGLTAVGLVLLQVLDGNFFWMVVLFAVVYGIGAAGALPLRVPIIREYFGVKKFGTILGLTAVFVTIGVGGGAPLAGWVYDTYGTYSPIWFVYAGACLAGMVLVLFIPPPPGGDSSTRDLFGIIKKAFGK